MTDSADRPGARLHRFAEGAVGAGIVLVLLPSMVLVGRMKAFTDNPSVGYPILAIFGIMILLGALALVSTLFNRLGLSAPNEALGLPPGSIRATIALSLIVLFALLSVMLYRSLSEPGVVVLKGLTEAAKQQLVNDPSIGAVQVTPLACSASSPCAAGDAFRYDVQIGHAASGPAIDFAKQLLTLIGTLMTSAVSFYFAAKSTETVASKAMAAMKAQAADTAAAVTVAASTSNSQPGAPDGEGDGDHEHGGVSSPTDDQDLPPAQGGVAKESP